MFLREPLTEPTPTEVESLPTAVVRHRGVTMDGLPNLFDQGYAAIAATGVQPSGPAFAIYRGDLSQPFDLDIGFPVAEPLPDPVPGEVTVEPSTLPAGDALAVSHLGSYDQLPQSWGRLFEEAKTRGAEPTAMLEVYVTEPSPQADPAAMRTDLYFLL